MANQFKQLLLTALLALGLAAPASADMMGVYADVPVQQVFSGSDMPSSGSPSGYMVGVTLPFFLGFGYEAYTTPINEESLSDLNLTTTMYNLFLDVPFPMLNVVVGAGVGKHNLECAICEGVFKEENASQTFVNLGWPLVLGVFDVHVGYHLVNGKVGIEGSDETIDTKSEVTSLGIKIGF